MRPPHRESASFGIRTVSTTPRWFARLISRFTHDAAIASRSIQISTSKSRWRRACVASLRRPLRIDGSPRRLHTSPHRQKREDIACLRGGRTKACSGGATKTRAVDASALRVWKRYARPGKSGSRGCRPMPVRLSGWEGRMARYKPYNLNRPGAVAMRAAASANSHRVLLQARWAGSDDHGDHRFSFPFPVAGIDSVGAGASEGSWIPVLFLQHGRV